MLSAPISSPLVSPLPRGGSGMDPAQKARRSSSSSASCAHGGQRRDPCTTGIPERGTGVIPAEGERLRDLPDSSFSYSMGFRIQNLYFNRTQLGHLPFPMNSDFLFPSPLSGWVFEIYFLSAALTALLHSWVPIPFPLSSSFPEISILSSIFHSSLCLTPARTIN